MYIEKVEDGINHAFGDGFAEPSVDKEVKQ